jgi:hypothetical protein
MRTATIVTLLISFLATSQATVLVAANSEVAASPASENAAHHAIHPRDVKPKCTVCKRGLQRRGCCISRPEPAHEMETFTMKCTPANGRITDSRATQDGNPIPLNCLQITQCSGTQVVWRGNAGNALPSLALNACSRACRCSASPAPSISSGGSSSGGSSRSSRH